MFTVTLYLVFRILPLLLGSSRNLCLYQTWTRQIIVVDPRIRGLGGPLGKLVDLSKGLWLEVRSLRRCGCADKAASRGEGNYFVTDYNWTTSDIFLFSVH